MVATPATDNDPQNPSPLQLPGNLPADVREWLSRTSATLVRSFANDLRSLILFGSAAEGRMCAGTELCLRAVSRCVERRERADDTIDRRLRWRPRARVGPMLSISMLFSDGAERRGDGHPRSAQRGQQTAPH